MKPKPKAVAKSFKATLERMPSNLGWVTVRIPVDVPKVWGTRARLRVKGEINGFAIRSFLFPTGKGFHCLTVNKRMQAGGPDPPPRRHRAVPPRARHRKTRRHHPRRTPAHPQRRPFLPPLVRPAH